MRIRTIVVLMCLGCSQTSSGDGSNDAVVQPLDSNDTNGIVSPPFPLTLTESSGLLGLGPSRSKGVSLVDFTGDGWPDITVVQEDAVMLLRNRGNGTFEPPSAGLGLQGAGGMGVTYADVDADEDLDLLVTTCEGTDRLFLNDGNGDFTDVTDSAGINRFTMSEGASFGDLDGDGDLDAYVSIARRLEPPVQNDEEPGTSGGPNIVWRNDGAGHFDDASVEFGLEASPSGESFGSLLFDLDGDGDVDVLTVHDFIRDQVFLNNGGGQFHDASHEFLTDQTSGLMGQDAGDVDGDGDMDVYATDWGTDDLFSWVGMFGSRRFVDRLPFVLSDGINGSANNTGWGCALIDLDNDADLDVVTTSGVSDGYGEKSLEVMRIGKMTVLENMGMGFVPGGMVDQTANSGEALLDAMSGHGLAVGDFDRDGDVDILVGVDGEAKAANWPESLVLRRTNMLLRNDSARAAEHQWLQLDLSQPGTANPFGVGARVDVSVGSKQTSRVLLAGSSYLSTHSYTLHFGLGLHSKADWIRVTWPMGAVQLFVDWPAGQHRLEAEANTTCCRYGKACQSLTESDCLAGRGDVDPSG